MTRINEKEQNQEKIQYTIRFTPSTVEEIEEMAKEEGMCIGSRRRCFCID